MLSALTIWRGVRLVSIKLHDGLTGQAHQFFALLAGCQARTVARQRETQGFHQAVHGVGGEHARTRAAGGAGLLLQFEQLAVVDLASLVRAHALKDADEVYRTPVGKFACRHGAAADEDGGDVDAHGGHEHTRHDFIAVGDAYHAIEAVRLDHRFDTIGDQFATGQRVLHADMSHGDTVIDADGVKFKRNAACRANGLFDQLAKGLQVNMPRHDVYVGVADGDEGLVKIIFADNSGCAQQSPVRSALEAELDLIRTHDDSLVHFPLTSSGLRSILSSLVAAGATFLDPFEGTASLRVLQLFIDGRYPVPVRIVLAATG